MNRTAYLVVHIDTADPHHPPVVAGAGIYSEPAQSLTGACGRGKWACDVTSMPGDKYDDAVNELKNALLMNPEIFGWVTRLLKDGGQW
jgi:hypothetical protein